MADKSCYKCKHLEWVDSGSAFGTDCGYRCNKRHYRNEHEESQHLAKLEKEDYLQKGKSCCEPKAN